MNVPLAPKISLLDCFISSWHCMMNVTLLPRYGFPPRELHPPDKGHEEDPVPLQHGDRVMVEHLKPIVPEERPPDAVMSEVKTQGCEGSASSETGGSVAEAKSSQQIQGMTL